MSIGGTFSGVAPSSEPSRRAEPCFAAGEDPSVGTG